MHYFAVFFLIVGGYLYFPHLFLQCGMLLLSESLLSLLNHLDSDGIEFCQESEFDLVFLKDLLKIFIYFEMPLEGNLLLQHTFALLIYRYFCHIFFDLYIYLLIIHSHFCLSMNFLLQNFPQLGQWSEQI